MWQISLEGVGIYIKSMYSFEPKTIHLLALEKWESERHCTQVRVINVSFMEG